MKYVKTFESFSKDKPTVFVIHMHSKSSDDVTFNLKDLCNVIESEWDEPELLNTFQRNGDKIKAIVLTGAAEDPREHAAPEIPSEIFESDLPILGICYGFQWWMLKEGATIDVLEKKEQTFVVAKLSEVPLFEGLEKEMTVYMSHQEIVRDLPSGYKKIAETNTIRIAGAQNESKKFWGLQFHPERNWAHDVIFQNFLKINKL